MKKETILFRGIIKLTMVATLVSALGGCIDLRGQFNAYQDLKLVHTTVFGNERTRTVPKGDYRVKLTFSSKEKVKLDFKGPKDVEVKMKVPSRNSFPRENGRIDLPASATGQRYDLSGFIRTDYSYSRTYRERESCTYTVYERRCTTNCDGRGNCQRQCQRIPFERRGFQSVEYRFQYTDRYLKLEMVKPNSAAIVAQYEGDDRDASKIYSHQGPCR